METTRWPLGVERTEPLQQLALFLAIDLRQPSMSMRNAERSSTTPACYADGGSTAAARLRDAIP